jgi:hypothetical protein
LSESDALGFTLASATRRRLHALSALFLCFGLRLFSLFLISSQIT